MARKSSRKKAKLSDWIGLLFWTGAIYLMMFCILRFSAPDQSDPEYVQFPTDDEIKRIELGTN